MSSWSQEELDRLRDLAGQGWSTKKIGDALGRTKNSVVSKCHRLSIPLKNSPTKKESSARRGLPVAVRPARVIQRKVQRPTAPRVRPPDLAAAPESRNLKLIDLEPGQCRYVVEDAAYLFCGAPTTGTYCPYHKEKMTA